MEVKILKKKYIGINLILVMILFIVITFILANMRIVIRGYENLIYKGISINKVDVSHLNREVAIDKINKDITDINKDRNVKVQIDEKSYKISFHELGIHENVEEIVDMALLYGKKDKFIDKYKNIKKGMSREFYTSTILDEESFNKFLNIIEKEQNKSAVNATIDHEWNGFLITPHEIGRKIDGDALSKSIREEVDNNLDDNDIIVNVIFNKEYPKIMEDDLKTINTKISSYTTSFINSSFGRCRNIELAAKYIDNTVIMPGDEFSFNKIVGPTTPGKGFEYAKVIKNGTFVDEIGGGVCQVSSTLYNAVLKSNLDITERRNHSKIISYVPMGQDAMISYGISDFKFKNNFNYPVFLEAIVQNKEITFNMFSNEEGLEPQYEIKNEIAKEIKPKKEIIYDYSLSEGRIIIEQNGKSGYIVSTYRVRRDNGQIVEKILVGESIYAGKNTIVRMGKD
jgi:vancomycin resistance protein YoaR